MHAGIAHVVVASWPAEQAPHVLWHGAKQACHDKIKAQLG